jgi:hypothetical protein
MQEDLRRLARELGKETCPRRVIDETVRRIAAETPPPSRLRYAIPVTVVFAGVVLLCGLLVRSRLADYNARQQPQSVEQQAQRRALVARQAETALGLIGTILLDAGAHSKTVISDRAIPPLRNGLQTAKSKIIRHTEL